MKQIYTMLNILTSGRIEEIKYANRAFVPFVVHRGIVTYFRRIIWRGPLLPSYNQVLYRIYYIYINFFTPRNVSDVPERIFNIVFF